MPISDSQIWPNTLPLPLISPPRTIDPQQTELTFESGRKRVVREFEDYREIVDLEWNFTSDEFEIFQGFFEDDLANGAFPFYLSYLDPDDSSFLIETDYQFVEADYAISRADNVFNVQAVCILQGTATEELEEPFVPGLCGVIIEGSFIVEGGGTTFDCYAVGDYTDTDMEPAGTGILVVRNGDSPFKAYGEDFEVFNVGNLVLGTPSVGSRLTQMYYGDSPLKQVLGDYFETYSTGTLTDGTAPSDSGLTLFYVG